MVTLLFTSKKTISSVFIRLFTWSSWSHVALLTESGEVIEATGLNGVIKVPLSETLHNTYKHALVKIRDISSSDLEQVLITKLGSKYDFLGALGIGLRKKLGSSNRFSCGELIAWGFQEVGKPLFREGELMKISQEDIWRLAPDGDTILIKD